MSITLGIYGDSYACKNSWAGGLTIDNRPSWVYNLQASFNINNYALPGSTLSYTHDQFLKTNKSNDINIVFVTHWGRIQLTKLSTFPQYIPGLYYVEFLISRCKDPGDLAILNAAKDYYIYVENEAYIKKFHQMMISDIKAARTNTILVPCFPKSILTDSDIGEISMFDIGKIDNQYYGLDFTCVDKKHCHLNDNNNLIFATKLKDHIESGTNLPFKINLKDYVQPINEPVEYNFCM